MEKKAEVDLLSRHWGCSDKNIYALMKKPSCKNKLEIIKLGSLCRENNISEEELINIIEFLEKQKSIIESLKKQKFINV